jgi:hypothetical protein
MILLWLPVTAVVDRCDSCVFINRKWQWITVIYIAVIDEVLEIPAPIANYFDNIFHANSVGSLWHGEATLAVNASNILAVYVNGRRDGLAVVIISRHCYPIAGDVCSIIVSYLIGRQRSVVDADFVDDAVEVVLAYMRLRFLK